MPLVTKFTQACGVEHPIMQGGMHYVAYAEMAAAVSNAGGLGIITALTQPNPEDLRKEIRKTKALTNKPFAVNLTLLPAMVPPDYDAYAQVVVDEGIKIVETAGHNPKKFIEFFKKHNVLVIHKCTTIRHAMTAQRLGADFVSVDGFECAGHPGEDDVGNWVLVAKAGKKLTIPFVVSGGCATGSQLAAALALGAEGINMGTRFMATTEAPIHDDVKTAMVKAEERDTTLIFRSLRNTERVYNNATAQEVRKIEAEKPGDFGAIRHLVRGENYRKSFQETGDTKSSVWSCGQVIGLIEDVPTCKKLIDGIVQEAETIIGALPRRLSKL